ncbi:MAG: VWA domain-containing protein [Phycisphaerales bacterium]|jgi:hypothetical protein|nr:VWA domain-containing protein [Phycisphaerales bacterium]
MTFMNPWLLLGTLGIGLPILAHLLNRFQVKRTDWAAMRFLNRSVRVRSRQIRLRDILLLLLRCLAVLLLVLAFSKPAIKEAEGIASQIGERRAGVIIALDVSYSMAHSNGRATRFERAIEQVGIISEYSQPGDPVSLILLGGEHRVVLRNVAYDRERFVEVLEQLEVLPESLDLDSVPKQLQALAEDMDALQKEIYIVSDTQTQDWGKVSTQSLDALKDLGERSSVFMVPVSGGSENLAVTGLDLVSGELRKGSVARYRATVRNCGSNPASNVDVKCRVEGVQIDRKSIPMIAPGASETVSLFVPFYNAGSKCITAEIAGDALSTDNVRRVVALVRDRISVLCIDGSSGDAGRLIRAALMARTHGGEDEGYVVRMVQWPSFPIRNLDQADVVILADVPEITAEQARKLSRFVRMGNGLVWFAGDQVKINAWNKLSGTGPNALLPASLGSVVDTSDSLGVGKPLDPSMPDHAVCRPLQSLAEDLLSETRLLKRIAVEPADSSFSLLNLAGSHSPVLLEHSLGRGHVFMFTTSAQASWNNMALTPVFPMLMQQIVTYLAGREFEPPRVVGDPLSLSYVDQPDATDAVFDTPSDQTIIVPVREHRNQYVALLDKSREAGFYVARVSVQAPGMPVAVNVDTRESDVACLSGDELRKSLKGTGITVSASETDLAADIEAVRMGRSSWRFFILAGLAFLIIESLLADRILRRGRSTQSQTGPAPQQMEVA